MKQTKQLLIPIFTFILILILWQVGVRVSGVEKWLLPTPTLIAAALWESRELIFSHMTQTILETVLGLTLAVLLGIGVAMLMEWSTFFKNLLKPFLVISQTIPFIVLAPLLIIWLGYGILPKIVVIVMACFFPISMNIFDGFKSVDHNMKKLLQSMGANKWQVFRLATFPASLPYFFSGLRIAGAYAVGVAVVSEWLGAERGLGILLLRSAKSYQTEAVFASIIVISTLSLLLVGIIELAARRMIPWHFANKGGIA